MTVITLDNIGNPKHRSILRYISDIFDENRGRIEDHIALTKFNSTNHTILFNTESPDLNGKTLIPFDSDKLLFAPVKINSIICSDPKNNNSINTVIQPNNNNIWEAVSDQGIIKLFMRLEGKNNIISGFSVRFADAVRTKYRVSIALGNDEGEILSDTTGNGMDSSWDSNNHQFFQFSSPIQGVTKAVMTIELPGTNKDFMWKINNICLYSNMNMGSMKGLSDSGIITWSLIHNSTIRKDMESEPELSTIDTTPKAQKLLKTQSIQEPAVAASTDYAGSPLLYAPNRDKQFFDNLSPEEITSISNLPRLYTITDLPSTGNKIYTFQTKESDRTLTLKFSPIQEMNKYSDEAMTDLDKLVQSGQMKKGGYKNYILTMYLKLDNINQTNQMLLWKYGGFFFSKQQPQMARAVNITIPINNKNNDVPHVYSEYFFEKLDDRTDKLMMNGDFDFSGIEQGKWIGIQFIRDVDTQNKKSVQIVRINRNPMDDNGKLVNPYDFENYLVYVDEVYTEQERRDGMRLPEHQEHIPHIWSGVNEIVSVVGAEYVSLYGISLYDYIKE